MLRLMTLVAVLLASFQISWAFSGSYPIKPDPNLTPGRLCNHPDQYRYPEKIKYCERDVETRTKVRVIQIYDLKFGYHIGQQNRSLYKIDHYIPLCMGGSNDIQNLWPQHQHIFNQTDPLEGLLCEKMKSGRLKQVEAVELIRRAKNDLSQVRIVIGYANRL